MSSESSSSPLIQTSFHAHYAQRLEQLEASVAPRVQAIRARWAELRPDSPTLEARLKQLQARAAAGITPERIEAGAAALRAFAYRPTDVFIATAARSGTTLLQQLVHQLRTGGDMDFSAIDDVVPWLDLNLLLDIPLPAENLERFSPRAFKTHLGFDQLPPPVANDSGVLAPPARCIHGVRSPLDMMLSTYEFVVGWHFSPEELSLEEFIRDALYGMPVPHWIQLLLGYHLAAEMFPGQVLWVYFEELVARRAEVVRQIGHFLGLAALPDFEQRVEVATERTSIAFMKTHTEQFEDPVNQRAISAALGVSPRTNAKVKHGQVGRGHAQCSEALQAELNEVLGVWLEEALGVPSYEALLARARMGSEGSAQP